MWPPTPAVCGPTVCPSPETARKLVVTLGKNQGKRPSVATVYRILAEDEQMG
ncbi:hypothetical protein [Nonomuraea ceibae]|uniref:hypothetical protein n=1 Tax=Nonomuraea ceibae TaxID=1935170 RepID=UPI001C5F7B67|nr:hypothetical protein [Nonomuraea ceibae]